MRAGDAEHVALARLAQDLLDLAHTIDTVRSRPGERHASPDRPLDHADREPRLGGKANRRRHVSRGQTGGGVGPVLGQVKPAVDEGLPLARDVGREHPDLTVGDLAR
jgi:hypothetical protein